MAPSLQDPRVAAIAAAMVTALMCWVAALVWRWRTGRRLEQRAKERARPVIRGQVSEQLAPMLGGFRFAAADARFLGAPLDYVVFDGYSAGDEVAVVFVEVKTGKARLSPSERRVREAIEAGRVRFEILRLPGDVAR